MKTKKLFLIIALVVGCAVGAHAQKTVFKFRDAQARAGDADSFLILFKIFLIAVLQL